MAPASLKPSVSSATSCCFSAFVIFSPFDL
jgi:hypothetical protein